jgi:hypothetical protein
MHWVFFTSLGRDNKGCVTLCGLALYIKKRNLRAKEELWKTQIFSPCKNIIFKKSSKRTTILPSRYLL